MSCDDNHEARDKDRARFVVVAVRYRKADG